MAWGDSYPVPTDPVAPDGAVSVNSDWEAGKSPFWYIELQRTGATYIEDGVAREDPTLIDRGICILNWGFSHQASDGSFTGTTDPFHSTSFFVEAAARAALLLRDYHPVTYSAPNSYLTAVTAYTAHIRAAAFWLTRPDIAAAGQSLNLPYSHRRWLLAAALAESAELTGEAALARAAQPYAIDGLSCQLPVGWQAALRRNPDGSVPPALLIAPGKPLPPHVSRVLDAAGVNPEKSGYDVSYQAVGILFALRYRRLCPDKQLQACITDMIGSGLAWESQRVNVSGDVDTIGSSRIGREVDRTGALKKPDLGTIRRSMTEGVDNPSGAMYQVISQRMVLGHSPVSHAAVAPDGAVNDNAKWETGKAYSWSIAQQQAGADFIKRGILLEDETLIREGVAIFNWGFAQQSADGSFAGSSSIMWGTVQFVEEAAYATLLLRDYRPTTYAVDRQFYDQTVARYVAKLHAAALWLSLPETARVASPSIAPSASRCYAFAAALGQTAQLTGDASLSSSAVPYARAGQSMQMPDGENPENGGPSVNDQAMGLGYAHRYAASGLIADLPKLTAMVNAGLHWEMGWVSVGGDVSGTTSPRTDVVADAFRYGYEMTNLPSFRVVANRIDSH